MYEVMRCIGHGKKFAPSDPPALVEGAVGTTRAV